jgi:hypothetical protein
LPEHSVEHDKAWGLLREYIKYRGMAMKTIQSQDQSEELRSVIEKIVQELENSHLYNGKLSIERDIPLPGTPTDTPAGYPHLLVQEEKQRKFLGLIPYVKKEILFIVKEGFYDVEDKGKKDMFVLLKSKSSKMIVQKHLEDYAKKNQVTEIVYKT